MFLVRPFMPRDNDKDNASSRGRRDRPPGGKRRSGAARGPEKKLAKRGLPAKAEGGKRSYAGKAADAKSYARKSHAGADKPYARKRDGADAVRPRFNRDDRPTRSADWPHRRSGEDDRSSRKDFRSRDSSGEKRVYAPRGDRPFGDKKFSRSSSDRGGSPKPRRDVGDREGRDRSDEKPWQKRERGEPRREARPPRDDTHRDTPRFSRPREDQEDRPKFQRPRGERNAWQERPRRDNRDDRPRRNDRDDRPRRDNEDDSRIFVKRPAFGGRGAYRDRKPDDDRRGARPEPKPKKAGERIAKVMSRAGLASRRDAEEWVTQGRVAVNGRIINSPALDVTSRDVITVDGQPLPERERTRLFLYHKPRGLMTTHADPEGRPTVFDNLPEGLPRLISVGRLDFNTEGLLLLTNDGGLARALELPDTGWLRRYRVRAHGEVTQAQLDALKHGVEVDGVKYGSVDATLERDQGANVWLTFAIREGKNREVRNVMAHLGLEVNRLIRVSYGPFQLAEIAEGEVEEVKTRVLREQLGDKIAAFANANFAVAEAEAPKLGRDGTPLRSKKDNKARAKRSVIEDRKGRNVVVQRTGSDEARARNEAEANGYGPPRRPKRGYHGKRDLTPRD
jgi:23S rRNA pseudouridine2605 synthase